MFIVNVLYNIDPEAQTSDRYRREFPSKAEAWDHAKRCMERAVLDAENIQLSIYLRCEDDDEFVTLLYSRSIAVVDLLS